MTANALDRYLGRGLAVALAPDHELLSFLGSLGCLPCSPRLHNSCEAYTAQSSYVGGGGWGGVGWGGVGWGWGGAIDSSNK